MLLPGHLSIGLKAAELTCFYFKLHMGIPCPGSSKPRRDPSSLLEGLMMWISAELIFLNSFAYIYEKQMPLIRLSNNSQILKSPKLPALIRRASNSLDKLRMKSPPEVSIKIQVTVSKHLCNPSHVQLPRTGCHQKLPVCICTDSSRLFPSCRD